MLTEARKQKLWILEHPVLPAHQGSTVYSPLHYGETAEVILTRGIKGSFTVNGQKIPLAEETALFIPPRQLHAAEYTSGGEKEGDMIWAFHIDLHRLEQYSNIPNLLHAEQKSLYTIANQQDDFNEIHRILSAILAEGAPLSAKICNTLQLFELLSQKQPDHPQEMHSHPRADRIVEWLENHYPQKVTVQQAAESFGYSKYYFCKWIKANTDSTFNELLNAIRINHACTHLIDGVSVAETAMRCGFVDPSYFIKVFKKSTGITPRAYVTRFATP